jgi:DNA-binding cell septation regulator SpoVG
VVKNTLRGFATVQFPSGMIIHEVAVHANHRGVWASPPGKPMTDRSGQLMRDDDGKQRYVPIISFASKQVRDQWSRVVIEALQAAYPGALEMAQESTAA